MTAQIEDAVAEKVRAVFGADAYISSLTPLAGDASSRRYFRAELGKPRAPATIVIMTLPAESALPLSSEELAVFKEPLQELPFLNLHRFLSSVGVRVPKMYGYWAEEGILLLEDLGDTALWDKVQGLQETEVLRWYERAIDALLLLQVTGTRARDDDCIAFQQRFDYRLYMWEFEHFLEYGLTTRPGPAVSSSAVSELRGIFSAISERLDKQIPCLNHRDFHSWNLMVHEEAIAVIDFQDALLAPPQYDLASLLNDRITDTVITPERADHLLRYYRDQSARMSGIVSDDGDFLEIYLLSAIQRDLKVVGRFFYLDLVKGKPAYRKFIPPTLRRLRRHLPRLPQTMPVLAILTDYYEEMR